MQRKNSCVVKIGNSIESRNGRDKCSCASIDEYLLGGDFSFPNLDSHSTGESRMSTNEFKILRLPKTRLGPGSEVLDDSIHPRHRLLHVERHACRMNSKVSCS